MELLHDCSTCRKFCCISLSTEQGRDFPTTKIAGDKCTHLSHECGCKVWSTLGTIGPSCLKYECYGAGNIATDLGYDPYKKEGMRFFADFRLILEYIFMVNSIMKQGNHTHLGIEDLHDTLKTNGEAYRRGEMDLKTALGAIQDFQTKHAIDIVTIFREQKNKTKELV